MNNHRPHFILVLAFLLLSLTPVQAEAPSPVTAQAPKDEAAPKQVSKKAQRSLALMQQRKSPLEMKLIGVSKLKDLGIDGQIFFLDGKKIVLDNIRIPSSAMDAAKEVLREYLTDKETGIYVPPDIPANKTVNKTGFILAHLVTEKNVWIQELLVSRGLAWVEATSTKSKLAGVLLKVEDTARKAQIGFWKIPEFAVKTDQNIGLTIGSYQIYEGVVRDTVKEGPYYFLRFSSNPKGLALIVHSDVVIEMSNTTPYNLLEMKGSKLRLRGWIENNTGPSIVLTEADQMEVLEKPLSRIDLQKMRKEEKIKSRKKPEKATDSSKN